MSSSPFVVRLPGASAATAASSIAKPPPVQSFVMDHHDFPGVEGMGCAGPVAPVRSEGRAGAWATRPILHTPSESTELELPSPIGRSNAQSPVTPSPPPAHHLVPPSPSPSDLAADELAADLDGMDMTYEPCIATSELSADADPYSAVCAHTELLKELAYYRAAAEHWHGICIQMQTHVAMVCGPLNGPPPL